jgi:hypothetical protein
VSVFTPEERDRVRSALIADAYDDAHLTDAAITGTAAAGLEDEWSHVDLHLGLGDAADLPSALADWTARMYHRHGAVHHVDVALAARVGVALAELAGLSKSPSRRVGRGGGDDAGRDRRLRSGGGR